MLLAMRRESEHHTAAAATASNTTSATDTNGLAPNLNASNQYANNLGITANLNGGAQQDSLNTPSTPLLNLGRSPLQFPPPPPPPISVQTAATQFGFYTPNATGATYLHHYTHPTTTQAAITSSVGGAIVTGNGGTVANINRSGSTPAVELDEYVDILQVQQLLLDSSSSANQQTIATANNCNSSSSIPANTAQQQTLPKPRPRLNLQKATEYAAQVQADSPSSRRMLLDYPSPYLYGNHYHSSPSEDLVALWFGSNGSDSYLVSCGEGKNESPSLS
ncbi:uncharacterized protein LOC119675986 [Teleopsis dalmanni]|uniref:uncharacterized protein LOC119675986 n=1 Tax=Teleopsis dalmanni TaxID=139649 RepID=UPI0018CCA865|nr:uncharacterized protein LOC119675986 [Teleopsis dalmanni]